MLQPIPEARRDFRIFFPVPIDSHLEKSVDLFQLYTVSECQKGPYLVGKPKESSYTMPFFEPTVVESKASHKASRIKWGTIHEGEPLSGIWSKEVTVPHHIDELEMLAGENVFHHYCLKIPGKFVQVN